MEKWGVILGKTILPKNFGKKPKPIKQKVAKNCITCGIKFFPKLNNGRAKFCNDCKIISWQKKAKYYQRLRAGYCIKCQLKIVGERVACENEQGKNELFCKPCYQKALQEN